LQRTTHRQGLSSKPHSADKTAMKKLALIILDGWGIGDRSKSDAIANAHTPFMDSLYTKYPHSQLLTSGGHVGLPDGQMGNSEVGHLNIGAGRIVYQDLAKINNEVKENRIDTNPVLIEAMQYARANGKSLHLMGLLSDGGVHSHYSHLYKLCDMAKKQGLTDVFIHVFTDGRDTDPRSGLIYIEDLEKHLGTSAGRIATVIGRYYAMDRDKRWERVRIAYDLLVNGIGTKTSNVISDIQSSYNMDVTDEFIKPIVVTGSDGNPVATIKDGDAVICFNFRTDRCREITQVLTQHDMPEFGMQTLPLHYVTMTNYDETFTNVHVVYDKDNLTMTLGEVLSRAGKKQIRIAETEKYPHVTFFFSGGREEAFQGEKRILIPSPKVATYDLQPEMSANELTQAIIPEMEKAEADFICLNFANPDMVGHTGVYDAVIKAVETVDNCTRKIVEAGIASGYSFLIIADHGNADFMINPDGTPNTAHTTNPVPCILIDKDIDHVRNGKLADIAPTVLAILGLSQPPEMTGEVLVL
jgi:2,3-bisphosphoglycerate-independent phosphoglycerate mutase